MRKGKLARIEFEKAQAERPPTRWMSTSRRGQDVRGVAPSTVAANIQGVFSLVLPGVDISQRRAVGTYNKKTVTAETGTHPL